eukprot:2710083-Prymnesium_polylepis.1
MHALGKYPGTCQSHKLPKFPSCEFRRCGWWPGGGRVVAGGGAGGEGGCTRAHTRCRDAFASSDINRGAKSCQSGV